MQGNSRPLRNIITLLSSETSIAPRHTGTLLTLPDCYRKRPLRDTRGLQRPGLGLRLLTQNVSCRTASHSSSGCPPSSMQNSNSSPDPARLSLLTPIGKLLLTPIICPTQTACLRSSYTSRGPALHLHGALDPLGTRPPPALHSRWNKTRG